MTTRLERLASEMNVWLATVRPDGRPHLTPIWFVWVEERMWLCTQEQAVKARNVRSNPKVSVALENGSAPVTGEGIATIRRPAEVPPAVRDAFVDKYEWDIDSDADGYGAVIEITIEKWLYPSGETAV